MADAMADPTTDRDRLVIMWEGFFFTRAEQILGDMSKMFYPVLLNTVTGHATIASLHRDNFLYLEGQINTAPQFTAEAMAIVTITVEQGLANTAALVFVGRTLGTDCWLVTRPIYAWAQHKYGVPEHKVCYYLLKLVQQLSGQGGVPIDRQATTPLLLASYADLAAALALPQQCSVCGVHTKKKCGRCGAVGYCSTDCLRADRKLHKPFCGAFSAEIVPADYVAFVQNQGLTA
jgi:hypothetical protein